MNKKTKTQISLALVLALAISLFYGITQTNLLAQNEVYVSGIMLTYDDGTTEMVNSNQQMTMIDYNSGRTVVSISTVVSVTPNYIGNLASYSFNGRSSFIFAKSTTDLINLSTQTLSATGTYLAPNQATNIIVGSSPASSMETLVRNYGAVNNIYYRFILHTEDPVSLTLTFTNGIQQTKTYNLPDFQWSFKLI